MPYGVHTWRQIETNTVHNAIVCVNFDKKERVNRELRLFAFLIFSNKVVGAFTAVAKATVSGQTDIDNKQIMIIKG